MGTAWDFMAKLDKSLEDAADEGQWIEIKAKENRQRWLWTHRRLKGAIEIEHPTGEVFLRGNLEQQVFLLALVEDFTTEYVGTLPKPPKVKRFLPRRPQQKTSRRRPTGWSL